MESIVFAWIKLLQVEVEYCFCHFTLSERKMVSSQNMSATDFHISSMVYPGLYLGIPFFAKRKSKGSWESGSLGYGGKAPRKKFHVYIQRVF